MYDNIRSDTNDVALIADKTGLKEKNIKNNDEHRLDRHGPEEIKKFDPYLEQSLAWERLKDGKGTEQDMEWLKHETAERHHEKKFNTTYTPAHDRAQAIHDGHPWDPETGTGMIVLRLRQPPQRLN